MFVQFKNQEPPSIRSLERKVEGKIAVDDKSMIVAIESGSGQTAEFSEIDYSITNHKFI
jgi:hypothetical protein